MVKICYTKIMIVCVITTERVGQLVRGCPSLTKVSCSSLGHAAALKLGWESFAALVVLPGLNPDLVGAPVVPDTGWFNQKKKKIVCVILL